MSGTVVIVRGIVVGDFETINSLQGFYIQSETPDGDPLTSEGLFVYNNWGRIRPNPKSKI